MTFHILSAQSSSLVVIPTIDAHRSWALRSRCWLSRLSHQQVGDCLLVPVWALGIWNVIEGRARYRRPHAPARHGDAFIAGVRLFLPSFVNVAVAHST